MDKQIIITRTSKDFSELGKKGMASRWRNTTPEQRKEMLKPAHEARRQRAILREKEAQAQMDIEETP